MPVATPYISYVLVKAFRKFLADFPGTFVLGEVSANPRNCS